MTNQNIQSKVIDLLSKELDESTIDAMNKWLDKNKDKISNHNDKHNLKVNDIITFKNGFDIPMSTKIIGFDIETGNAYLYWDCYWFSINLDERLIPIE